MRTTLTLDDDIARELRDKTHRSGRSFNQIVNETLRTGLADRGTPAKRYRVRPQRVGAPAAGIDLDRSLTIAERLEDVEIARKLRSRK